MDIEYLLWLQDLRDASGTWLPDLMIAITKVAVGAVPLAVICLVYWIFDRQIGKRIIGGLVAGLFMNGLLKLIFCTYRPWIRDSRIKPYGDVIATAGGYSFPSGHTTCASACYGGIAKWQRRKGHIVPFILIWAFVALIMFSRNFLGVHTPQDVLVGFVVTMLLMDLVYHLEAWTDADPDKRDVIVMVAGIAISIAAAIFYLVKPYPTDYAADGTLLVDPAEMINDSFKGIGLMVGYVVARYFERRGFDFEGELTRRERAVSAVVALIPLVIAYKAAESLLPQLIGTACSNVVIYGVLLLYVMVAVPAAMSLVPKHRK